MDQATKKPVVCPDCEAPAGADVHRRDFMRAVGVMAATAAGSSLPLWATPRATAAPTPKSAAETAVAALYETLTEPQKKKVCFAWDHKDDVRGLLRTHVSNNWHITEPTIDSDFFTQKQRWLIHDVFKGIFNPDWYGKILTQLKDDTSGRPWGAAQNIALFGKPGDGKFEFVMTGRHMTIRCDGNSESHVALGGPIFHGHAASGFNEKVGHPGNVFWHQGQLANKLYQMLSGAQQRTALVEKLPPEADVPFQGPGAKYPGLPVTDMSTDQKEHLQKVLMSLVEPYRKEDQQEVQACLAKHGGLDKCNLAFYREGDIGNDGEWDNWRLEGPSFVWYFRGYPHVHIWINVADDPSVALNSAG